jgi:hypothetical protein
MAVHRWYPGESGVGGGMVAVVPGQYAIAVYSPPLDAAGNSVRAQQTIAYVAEATQANLFSPLKPAVKAGRSAPAPGKNVRSIMSKPFVWQEFLFRVTIRPNMNSSAINTLR